MAEHVRFTEEMKGHVGFGAHDYWDGYRLGVERHTPLMFHLTIEVDDIGPFLADPEHEATATGWVGCPALGGDRLAVTEGRFNLFAPATRPGRQAMRYRLFFADGEGRPTTLAGFKDIGDDPGLDTWKDTTSLSTKVMPGHVDAAGEAAVTPLALGLIYIRIPDFAKQLTTFRGSPRGVWSFGKLFAATLWEVYRGGGAG